MVIIKVKSRLGNRSLTYIVTLFYLAYHNLKSFGMVLYAILYPADGAMFASLKKLSRFTIGNYNS